MRQVRNLQKDFAESILFLFPVKIKLECKNSHATFFRNKIDFVRKFRTNLSQMKEEKHVLIFSTEFHLKGKVPTDFFYNNRHASGMKIDFCAYGIV
jgi:hypothetical protein